MFPYLWESSASLDTGERLSETLFALAFFFFFFFFLW